MANILDIFRTHSGNQLLERATEETSLLKTEASRAFLFALPSLLSVHKSQCETGAGKFADAKREFKSFIDFIEAEDICISGKKVLNLLLTPNQFEKFSGFSRLLGISQNDLEKILEISAGALFSILTEISAKKSLKREDHCELLDSLAGISTKFDKDFINTLVKNEDSPHLIDSAEKISLDSEDDDDDLSILGGYTGGR